MKSEAKYAAKAHESPKLARERLVAEVLTDNGRGAGQEDGDDKTPTPAGGEREARRGQEADRCCQRAMD